MQVKTVKKRKGKYGNDSDRMDAIKRNKIKSYHKCKKVKVKPLYGSFNDRYRLGLFRYLITKNFHAMITLTHKTKVTLKEQETIVNRVLQKIVEKGYINCYFKANELENHNYHCHILVEDAGVARNLTGVFKGYWKKYGFTDVGRFKSLLDKYEAVDYCVKQLKPMDRRHAIQELIDTWDYYEPAAVVFEVDLFRNEAFLASIWHEREYTYQRPAGSLLIPGMTLSEAFNRIQAKMDNQKQAEKQLLAIYI